MDQHEPILAGTSVAGDDEAIGAETPRERILALVEQHAGLAHAPKAFKPGTSPVSISGKVYVAPELLVRAGPEQQLRQALRLAARRGAGGLRS